MIAGFGGSNAAVILERAPPNLVENGVNGHAASLETKKLLVFSARTAKSLQDYLASFGDYLSEAPLAKIAERSCLHAWSTPNASPSPCRHSF